MSVLNSVISTLDMNVRKKCQYWYISLTVSPRPASSAVRSAVPTPDQPGSEVKPGTIFPLHTEMEKQWMQWSPAIWIDTRPKAAVHHAISEEHDRHLFGEEVVTVETVSAETGSPAAEPSVSSGPPGDGDEDHNSLWDRMLGRD